MLVPVGSATAASKARSSPRITPAITAMPYLGLCLGLQCAVIEFARDVIGTSDANSTEFDMFTEHPVIELVPDQREMEDKGGTMLRACTRQTDPGFKGRGRLRPGGSTKRHRHRLRWDGPADHRERRHAAVRPIADGRLVGIVELKDHPWFVASQFHPELQSATRAPAPAVRAAFCAASIAVAAGREPVLVARHEPAPSRQAATVDAG